MRENPIPLFVVKGYVRVKLKTVKKLTAVKRHKGNYHRNSNNKKRDAHAAKVMVETALNSTFYFAYALINYF